MAHLNYFFLAVLFLTNISPSRSENYTVISENCNDIPQLQTVLGFGWNSLMAKETVQIFDLSYKQCKTTKDGKYLIPDQAEEMPKTSQNTGWEVEIIDKMSAYTPILARGFQQSIEIPSVTLYGSFSVDYFDIKKILTQKNYVVCRLSFRKLSYRIRMKPEATVTQEFKQELKEYNKERDIVKKYGTHYTTQVDVGELFIQDDLLKYDYFLRRNRERIEADSKQFANFVDSGKLGNIPWWLEDYATNRLTHKKTKIISTNSVNNLTVIDHSGTSLTLLLQERDEQKNDKLNQAIQDYFDYNTYKGCMEIPSKNYDFNANVDDNSCNSKIIDYSFGGIYQKSFITSPYSKESAGWDYNKRNPLTGKFSCPDHYQEIHLHQKNMFFGHIESYLCIASVEENPRLKNSGYLFGGLFTSEDPNIVTKNHSCPEYYTPLTLFYKGEVTLCVSNKFSRAEKFAIPFAGLTTCKTGLSCPLGYVGHSVIIFEGCRVNYCIGSSAELSYKSMRYPYYKYNY